MTCGLLPWAKRDHSPFVHEIEHYRAREKDTIFPIKGPPGAGKAALLSELSELAKAIGYAVKDKVKPANLYDPSSMACHTLPAKSVHFSLD